MALAGFQPRVIEPKFRSGLNSTGSTITKGRVLKLAATPTAPFQIELATAATDLIIGVAAADIPTATYGDVQISGVAVVRCGGTVTAPAEVTAGAGGEAVAASAGDVLLGIAVMDGVDDGFTEVELTLGGTMD
jgi:hypothetical protein